MCPLLSPGPDFLTLPGVCLHQAHDLYRRFGFEAEADGFRRYLEPHGPCSRDSRGAIRDPAVSGCVIRSSTREAAVIP